MNKKLYSVYEIFISYALWVQKTKSSAAEWLKSENENLNFESGWMTIAIILKSKKDECKIQI